MKRQSDTLNLLYAPIWCVANLSAYVACVVVLVPFAVFVEMTFNLKRQSAALKFVVVAKLVRSKSDVWRLA